MPACAVQEVAAVPFQKEMPMPRLRGTGSENRVSFGFTSPRPTIRSPRGTENSTQNATV